MQEAKAYAEFIELSKRKKEVIEEFQHFWDEGSFKKTGFKFSEIKEINIRILRLLKVLVVDISKDAEATRSFFYKIITDMVKELNKKDFYYLE